MNPMKKAKYDAMFSLWGTDIMNSTGSVSQKETKLCQTACNFITFLATLFTDFAFSFNKDICGAFALLVTVIIWYELSNLILYAGVKAYRFFGTK